MVLLTMSAQLQSYVALAIVLVAIIWMAWRTFGRKKKPGCGGGCGCSADEFKEKLKH